MRIILKATEGAALLTVLIAMMIISIVLFEFQYATMIERKLSYNDLNQLQAYYLAKSGARLGLLRLAIYARAKKDPQIANLRKTVPNLDSYLENIWQLPLPPFPPKTETLGKLNKEDKDAAEQTLKETHLEEGYTTHVITNESSKINLNFLADIPAKYKDQRISFNQKPESLFDFTGYSLVNLIDGFIRASDNPNEEYGNLKPEEVVMDVIDWITPSPNRLSGGSKDAFYEQQNPPYKAKRNRFYTVDELRMVRGMDDRLFTKLKPYVTVYSYDGRININSISNDMLKVLYKDFNDDDIKRINEEKDRVGGWASEDQFVKFVTETLGRSGFKTLYPPPNYPFTVTTQSFLIESMGLLTKSQSNIQKIIRVAVAMASGKGGRQNPNIKDANSCNNTPGYFWHQSINACYMKTKTPEECASILSGSPSQRNNLTCCTLSQSYDFCFDPARDGAAFKDAFAMRILYWSET